MNVKAIRWALDQKCGLSSTNLGLIKLASVVDVKNNVELRFEEFATLCGFTRMTADTVTQRLVERGFVECERIVFDGRKSKNRYTLLVG